MDWMNRCKQAVFMTLSLVLICSGCTTGTRLHPIKADSKGKNPEFFNEIDPIVVEDELGGFLGGFADNRMEIHYVEVAKMAGHSCLVVGGAYLSAQKGLKALYGDTIPQRGMIRVEIRRAPTEENAGVVGSVLANITGATTDFGFGGLPDGRFNRRNLLVYNAPIDTDIRLTRLDTGKRVGINCRPGRVVNPKKCLREVLAPDANAETRAKFPRRIQKMVHTLFQNQDRVMDLIPLPPAKGVKSNG